MNSADVRADLAALAKSAKAGDREALEQLLARTRPQIHRYVLARLVDRALADDVTQEVAMTVMSALPRYVDTGRSVLAWMFGIAQHKVSEAHRAGGRRRENMVSDAPEHRAPDRNQPEQATCELETVRELSALLDTLPAPQGEILRLRIAAGLSADEVAAVLGMTPGGVRVAQHRALARLRTAALGKALR